MYKPGLKVVNQSQFKCSNPYSTLRKTSFWSTKFTDSTSCKAVHYCKIYLVKAYQNWKEPQSCVEWLIFCPFWCQWHFCDWLQLHPNFFPSTFCTWTDTFFLKKVIYFVTNCEMAELVAWIYAWRKLCAETALLHHGNTIPHC